MGNYNTAETNKNSKNDKLLSANLNTSIFSHSPEESKNSDLDDFINEKVTRPLQNLCERNNINPKEIREKLDTLTTTIRLHLQKVYSKNTTLHNRNNDLKQQIDSLESRLKKLGIECDLKNTDLNGWTNVLKEATLKLKNTEEELKKLKETNKTQVTELESKTNKISELESEVNTLKERKEEIERENKETKSKLNNTTNALKSKTEEFDKLTEKNKEIEEVLKSKTNKISELESEVNVFKENNKKNAEELNETKSQLEKTGKELSNQKLQLEQKQTKAKEDKEQISKVEKELKNLKAIKKQTAEMFLSVSDNTNVTARKFSLIYFFAWLFQCIPCCKGYINRIRAIRDLNNKFDALRNRLALKNDNDIENAEDKDTPKQADEIFCALDKFLPDCNEVNLFNRYVFIYCNLLDLYQHDTNKIYQELSGNLRIGPSYDLLKEKIDQLNVTDNKLNNGNNINNENKNIINTNNFLQERNEDELKSGVNISDEKNNNQNDKFA